MKTTKNNKRKYTEKICRNCKHWTKSHKDEDYGLFIGICELGTTLEPKEGEINVLPYENADCKEWEKK
jgi:hypothetical protein